MGYGSVGFGTAAFGSPMGLPGFVSPATVDEGGLTLISPSVKGTTVWSVDNVTTMASESGATKRSLADYPDTEVWTAAPAQPGTKWLSELLDDDTGVVLLKKPDFGNLSPNVQFVVTRSALAVKALARTGGNFIVIGGPGAIIAQAKTTDPPPPGGVPVPKMGVCPADHPGVWPNCACPDGFIFNPLTSSCAVVPGTTPGGVPPVTPKTPPPGTPPTTPAVPPETKAAAGAPAWVLPTVIGVGAVAVLALFRSGREKK